MGSYVREIQSQTLLHDCGRSNSFFSAPTIDNVDDDAAYNRYKNDVFRQQGLLADTLSSLKPTFKLTPEIGMLRLSLAGVDRYGCQQFFIFQSLNKKPAGAGWFKASSRAAMIFDADVPSFK
jgi:hypothetical protein